MARVKKQATAPVAPTETKEEIVHTPTGKVVTIEEAAKTCGVTLTDEARPKRKINMIVLHCSDSDNPAHDNIETIRKWHTERGFVGPDGVEGTEDDIGYHFVITKDGKLHQGRDINSVGAHVKGHNEYSVGICLTGKGQMQFTSKQFRTANKLVKALFKDHGLDWKSVKTHNELDKNKTCPNYKISDVVSG